MRDEVSHNKKATPQGWLFCWMTLTLLYRLGLVVFVGFSFLALTRLIALIGAIHPSAAGYEADGSEWGVDQQWGALKYSKCIGIGLCVKCSLLPRWQFCQPSVIALARAC